jgi:hypothetical protein
VDRWDPMRPANSVPWHTRDLAKPSRNGSARIGAPRRVIRRISSHESCSWLKGAALAATSAPGAGFQPSNS